MTISVRTSAFPEGTTNGFAVPPGRHRLTLPATATLAIKETMSLGCTACAPVLVATANNAHVIAAVDGKRPRFSGPCSVMMDVSLLPHSPKDERSAARPAEG